MYAENCRNELRLTFSCETSISRICGTPIPPDPPDPMPRRTDFSVNFCSTAASESLPDLAPMVAPSWLNASTFLP